MKCKFCGCKIRACKRIDFVDRDYHFSCMELENKLAYEKELKDFIQWFKEQGIDVIE
jgi:2-hydroxy-3-keto-5-methylthiopentenyl-1-phosphate phosphatase